MTQGTATQPGFVKQSGQCLKGGEDLVSARKTQGRYTLGGHQEGEGPTCHICQTTVRRLLGTKMEVSAGRLDVEGTPQEDFLRKGKWVGC